MNAQAAKPARKTASRKTAARKQEQAAVAPSFALVVAGELVQHVNGDDVYAAKQALALPAPQPLIIDGADLVREVADTLQAAEIESPADFTTTETIAPATVETTTEAAPMSTENTFTARMLHALAARPQASKDIDLTVSAIKKGERALNMLAARPEWSDVCESLVKRASVADKGNSGFVAVKAWVKIIHAMTGISAGIKGYFDPYSRTIIANLAAGVNLTNKGALVSLSKSIEFTALDTEQALKARYNCGASTATTQASSTRMMLQALGLYAVQKGKVGDVITPLENARTAALVAMFKTGE
jgi:hypothetical protein